MKNLPLLTFLALVIFYSCSGNKEEIQTIYVDEFGNEIPVVNGDTLCNVLTDSIHYPFPNQFIALAFGRNTESTIHDNLEIEYEIKGTDKDTNNHYNLYQLPKSE